IAACPGIIVISGRLPRRACVPCNDCWTRQSGLSRPICEAADISTAGAPDDSSFMWPVCLVDAQRSRPSDTLFGIMHRTLWIIQWLLAGLFLFAGIAKLAMPIQPMVDQTGLSANLLRFIAVMEILGALGLILPGLLHIQTKL